MQIPAKWWYLVVEELKDCEFDVCGGFSEKILKNQKSLGDFSRKKSPKEKIPSQYVNREQRYDPITKQKTERGCG